MSYRTIYGYKKLIKKESPNEGTETLASPRAFHIFNL